MVMMQVDRLSLGSAKYGRQHSCRQRIAKVTAHPTFTLQSGVEWMALLAVCVVKDDSHIASQQLLPNPSQKLLFQPFGRLSLSITLVDCMQVYTIEQFAVNLQQGCTVTTTGMCEVTLTHANKRGNSS